MDLIGSIQYLENRFGGRKPNQGKRKSVQKVDRSDTTGEKNAQTDANHSSVEYDSRLGRKLDVTV